MNEATLDQWITMRMLTPEVGEADLDGFRITVVERPIAKFDESDPDFEYTIRITKLRDVAPRRSAAGLSSAELADALRECIPVVDEMFKTPTYTAYGEERLKKAQAQNLHGRYMGLVGRLPARAKEAAKRIYKEKGVEAAIAYAKSVVRPKGKAK